MLRSLLPLLACGAPAALAQTHVDVTPPAGGQKTLSVDPHDPLHLVVSGLEVFESFDGGVSWSIIGSYGTTARARFDANGDLLLWRRARPTSQPGALQRRTAAGFVDLPVPALVGVPHDESISSIVPHPARADVLAVHLAGYDDYGGVSDRIFATVDDGGTWELVTSHYNFSDSYSGTFPFGFVPSPSGGVGRLACVSFWEDLENSVSSLVSWAPGEAGPRLEVDCPDFADCTMTGARSLPGQWYGSIDYGFVPGGSPSGTVLRRPPGGDWASVGSLGRFDRVAAGNVDPNLIVAVRGEFGPDPVVDVSRDGGATWSRLIDTVGLGLHASNAEVVLTRHDEYVYVVLRDGPPDGDRILRAELEATLGAVECPGVANATGRPGELRAVGLSAASGNRVLLSLRDLPPGLCYLPLVSRDAGFTANPGGSAGNLCLAGTIGRALDLAALSTDWGDGFAELDLARLPAGGVTAAALPGETWRFQVWYRDCAALGASNLTNSVAVTFN